MFRNAFWFTAGVVSTFASCMTITTYIGKKNPGFVESTLHDHLTKQ